MFKKLLYFLIGYVKVEITGEDKAKIINLALKNNLRIWNYKNTENSYTLYIRAVDYKKLTKLKKFTKTKMKIKQKAGIPLLKNKFKKRWGLLAGLIVGVFLYSFLYSHFWIIKVPDGFYTQSQILEVAKECGVYVGAKRDDINEKVCAYKMMSLLPKLQWISLNTNGCTIDIALKYIDEYPEIIDKSGTANVVAKHPGVIKSVDAQEGMIEVYLGQNVEKGDVLITGTWDTNRGLDEWEVTEEPFVFNVKARGVVMAQTVRSFEVSMEKTKPVYETIKDYKKYTFGFFGLKIPFTLSLAPKGDYFYEKKENYLWLFGEKMPIFLKEEKLTKLEITQEEVTKEEKEKELLTLLDIKIKEEMGASGKVLKFGEIFFDHKNNKYTARQICVCVENIAKTQEISTK